MISVRPERLDTYLAFLDTTGPAASIGSGFKLMLVCLSIDRSSCRCTRHHDQLHSVRHVLREYGTRPKVSCNKQLGHRVLSTGPAIQWLVPAGCKIRFGVSLRTPRFILVSRWMGTPRRKSNTLDPDLWPESHSENSHLN